MNTRDSCPQGISGKNEFGNAFKVSADFIKENYDIQRPCLLQLHHCLKTYNKKGAFSGYEIPEYETLWSFAPITIIADLEAIIKVNRLCNDYGIDTISAGSTIAAYAEIMGEDVKELAEIVKKIGENEGLGKELGNGSKALFKLRGKDVSSNAKGLNFPDMIPASSWHGSCLCNFQIEGDVIPGLIWQDLKSLADQKR